VDHRGEARVVDLPPKVLEEALQLIAITVGGREELLGIGFFRVEPPHVVDLHGQLAPKALGATPNLDRVAALESIRSASRNTRAPIEPLRSRSSSER